MSAIIIVVVYLLGYPVIGGGALYLWIQCTIKRMAAIYGPTWEFDLMQYVDINEELWFGKLKKKCGVFYDIVFILIWPVALPVFFVVSDIETNKLAAKFLKKAEG